MTRPPCGRVGGSSAAEFCDRVTGSQADTGGALNRREMASEMNWNW